MGASAIAPGDTIQRSVDLIDSGSLDLASVTLTTTATSSSLLDTDTTNGLQMVIDKCSVAMDGVGPALRVHVQRRDLDRCSPRGR